MIADRRSQIADRNKSCDRLRSYGNQPIDRTWFYLLRSSAIVIAGSQTIAEVVSIWSQTIADLIAISDLRSAIIWKPALTQSVSAAWKKIPFLKWGTVSQGNFDNALSTNNQIYFPHLRCICLFPVIVRDFLWFLADMVNFFFSLCSYEGK